VLLCLATALPLRADPLADPGIPDGETAVYRLQAGEQNQIFTERTTTDGVTYRFNYTSAQQTVETTVGRPSLRPIRVRTVSVQTDRTLETVSTVTFRADVASEGIPVLAFSDLKYSLRGYPFGSAKELAVEFLGATGGGGMSFTVRAKYAGVQDRVVAGRRIACHKLELVGSASGVLSVMAALAPKTYYWYSVEAPHYLVAYEGSSGAPGSSKSVIEITSYSGWR
jgi:hypothetical protein